MRRPHKSLTVLLFCLFFSYIPHSFAANNDWTNINGTVSYNGTPVCAMVLANGQYMFTCSGDGSFNLDVPLDPDTGQITVFAFCEGLAPFEQVIYPAEGHGMQIEMAAGEGDSGMDVTSTLTAISTTWVRLEGTVSYNGAPVCAMVLANGQYTFTCSGDGSYSLDVPIDPADGSVTLFSFCSSLPPYKYVYTNSISIEVNQDYIHLDNGTLKVGLDLLSGGAIYYLSGSNESRNLVNIADRGRYIQQSYYAGNRINRQNEGQSIYWSPWPWNPIQAGDAFGNSSEVLESDIENGVVYTKTLPLLWDMNNERAECFFEQWTTLHVNTVHVRNKLTIFRTDNLYGENRLNHQELPAVYPISALSNLFTYMGSTPFSNAPIDNPDVVNLSSGFWGEYPTVTEHWMAFVDNNQWGIGVYNHKCILFLAGMAGIPGGEARDGSTSYIAPLDAVILRKIDTYEYEYDLILGTVTQIRQFAYGSHLQ